MPFLTSRLAFRPLESSDIEYVRLFQNRPAAGARLGATAGDDQELVEWLAQMRDVTRKRSGLGLRLGFAAEGCVVLVGLLPREVSGELTLELVFDVHPDRTDRDYDLEAVRASRDRAFDTLLQKRLLVARARSDHRAAHVVTALGMIPDAGLSDEPGAVSVFTLDRSGWLVTRSAEAP